MVVVVCLVAFASAGLTLFSGFGLGTLLLPAFALFLPLPVAVAATAVVHLANNLFKTGMMWRFAAPRVVLWFAVPGMLASFAGARVLGLLADSEPLETWRLGPVHGEIRPDGLAIGGLILAFALLELSPLGRRLAFGPRWLPLGGLLSGFLGGLSGHQGALRSAFLIRLGLAKETYIGTGILCAVAIDLVRIPSYDLSPIAGQEGVVVAGTVSAFAGSWLGRRLMRKVTMAAVHVIVGVLLAVVGALIAAGVI